jgi:uncharacterized membrane protein
VNRMFFIHYGIFIILQVLAQVALNWGSGSGQPLRCRRWWVGFIAANAVGAPSILFLKELFQALPAAPNLVLVLVMAGVFILTQLVFIIFFKSRLTRVQWVGVALLTGGAILASLGR